MQAKFHLPAVQVVVAMAVLVMLLPLGRQAKAQIQEREVPVPVLTASGDREPLPGTARLTLEGDLSRQVVDSASAFVDSEIDQSVSERPRRWDRDFSSMDAYRDSVVPNRRRLGGILGMRDPRVEKVRFEFTSSNSGELRLAEGEKFEVYTVRWTAFGDVHGEGLLLEPSREGPLADVVAVPDADLTPEQLAGLVDGTDPGYRYAQKLAAAGCRVLVPVLVDRSDTPARLSYREWVYRPAYELGRHIIGYELHKILAGIDYFAASRGNDVTRSVGVIGWGEGGLLALHATALDERIDAAAVSGYFGPRENLWQEPAYRNVFGLLAEFGDAEVASLVAPRKLVIESSMAPELVLPGLEANAEGKPITRDYLKGKPGRIATPLESEVRDEIERAKGLLEKLSIYDWIDQVPGDGPGVGDVALEAFLAQLGVLDSRRDLENPGAVRALRMLPDAVERHRRQVDELVAHNEWALRESAHVRSEWMKAVDLSSLESFEESVEPFREVFRRDVIGEFDDTLAAANPQSRKILTAEGVTAYEVVIDVLPGLIAYGILMVPDDLKIGEKRPVVVCQHGLEGRPQQVIGEEKFNAYKAFATQLAQRGFVTFAPQNIYRGNDRFRLIQFKANSIGRTLFSVMVPQHQQIVNWLASLEFVDPARIAFYGLSYGGKSAMRIPPLVEGGEDGQAGYCLSICSADFNEWIWKNCSTRSRYSYADKREYEIFEWNLGNTFNYSEMAALIAPRPFMVERGHFDGVASDEKVAHEFAKVRRLYDLLGIGDRAAIEWFVGPHTINGVGTFEFLHRWLEWPKQ